MFYSYLTTLTFTGVIIFSVLVIYWGVDENKNPPFWYTVRLNKNNETAFCVFGLYRMGIHWTFLFSQTHTQRLPESLLILYTGSKINTSYVLLVVFYIRQPDLNHSNILTSLLSGRSVKIFGTFLIFRDSTPLNKNQGGLVYGIINDSL